LAFRGQYEHSLDAKDRITIPARFRAALAGGVVLAQGLDPCVEVYPLEGYSDFERRFLARLNPFDRDGRMMQRRFHSRSVDESLDSAGRIRIPGHLIEHAGLEGSCVIAGVMNRLEIWHPGRWAEENSRIDAGAEEISRGLAGGGGAPGRGGEPEM
jgi:MraZ protein